MPHLYTKAGWLTPYALGCGYIHNQQGVRLRWMAHSDIPIYEVVCSNQRCINLPDPREDEGELQSIYRCHYAFDNGIARTYCFYRLTDARKFFRKFMPDNMQRRYERVEQVNAII